MRHLYQAASLAFLVFSLFVVVESRKLNYYTSLGPGPGFFPFWLGLTMAALSITWFRQVTWRAVDPIVPPERAGVVRIITLLVGLILFVWLLGPLGFRLAMLGFLLVVRLALGRQHPLVTVTVAVAGSFGVYYVFHEWLGVPLPVASVPFLEELGL